MIDLSNKCTPWFRQFRGSLSVAKGKEVHTLSPNRSDWLLSTRESADIERRRRKEWKRTRMGTKLPCFSSPYGLFPQWLFETLHSPLVKTPLAPLYNDESTFLLPINKYSPTSLDTAHFVARSCLLLHPLLSDCYLRCRFGPYIQKTQTMGNWSSTT